MNYLILYFALIKQCLSLMIIPNNKHINLCINCKHFVPFQDNIKFAKCDKYSIINEISGYKILPFVYIIRNSELFCGKNGKNFEPIYKSKRIDSFERLFDDDMLL